MNGPLFLIPILAGLLAQSLKPFLNKKWYATLQEEGKHIPRYGGMPSAHTAFATSLATVVALNDGFYSVTFMIAVSLVIYILDDALRMRIFLSRHGMALQKLVSHLPQEEQKEYPYLEARLGHKGKEVIVGGIIGILFTFAMWFLYVSIIRDFLVNLQ